MKRGCFISLITWAACAGAYWYFTHSRLVPPLDWIIPVVAGLIMALVIGGLRNASMAARDAMRFSGEPGTMGERPRDGDLVTVSGHIRSTGSPMHAPISGRPAVAYTYDITHTIDRDDSVNEVHDYSGFGLSSAVIDSSYGPIRLLAYPSLDAFPKDSLPKEQYLQTAAKYIAETQFTNLEGFHPATAYHEMKDLLTGDEGHLKKDWRMVEAPKPDEPDAEAPGEEGAEPEDEKEKAENPYVISLMDKELTEQIVPSGELVSAIGRYSAEKSGIVADASHGQLQLLRGDARAAAGTLRRKMVVNVAVSLLFAAIVNGVMFGVLKLHKPGAPIATSSSVIREKTDALHEAAREGKIAEIEKIVMHGMPVDARDDDQTTPLMRAANLNTAQWLIDHGADVNAVNAQGHTPLIEHAGYGRAEIVRLLIKSGAKLDAVEKQNRMSALQFALYAEKLDVAQILRDAGAKDVTVTEKNGHALADSSGEVGVVREYLDAVQREDRKALVALSTFKTFDDVNFEEWKKVRFASGRLVSGYANDGAATIVMRGVTPSGTYVTWTYQLVRKGDGWKVTDERWETRLDSRQP